MVYNINALLDIVIGKELDSGTMDLIFDVSEWQKDYPDLKDYRVEVSTPNGIVYIPANVKLEGSKLIWPITNADTAIHGKGKFQIVASGEYEQRKTSDTRNLYVGKIIDGTGAADPPDPARPWVDEVLDAARRAEEAAERAEAAGGGGGSSGSDLPAVTDVDNGKLLAVNAGKWVAQAPATEVEPDNTRPITAAAVYATVGNIEALLKTI